MPYSTHSIRGEDLPSSVTFIDGGIIIGRRNGTLFQLLSITTKHILSTIKFVNGNQDDPDMFGHATYDSRINTLWVANSRRESLVAFRINLESTVVGGEEAIRGGFDQVVEFGGQKPTIHFVILTADADPRGDEAHAACVAAKVPPGEVALVAFSVHAGGVDQLLIRKDWFDNAFLSAHAKFPPQEFSTLTNVASDSRGQQRQQVAQVTGNVLTQQIPLDVISQNQNRSRTPTSEDVENDFNRDDIRPAEPKMRGGKGKNVNWKERENMEKNNGSVNGRSDNAVINDSSLGQALAREIRKTEENLHVRIGRLIGKEMDKQRKFHSWLTWCLS